MSLKLRSTIRVLNNDPLPDGGSGLDQIHVESNCRFGSLTLIIPQPGNTLTLDVDCDQLLEFIVRSMPRVGQFVDWNYAKEKPCSPK